jgi:hypothetical protein
MNFFKRLFSTKPQDEDHKPEASEQDGTPISGIMTESHFNERYTLQDLKKDPEMLDGCLKMVESYFLDNKLERRIETPVNHPANLDQTMDDGFGFKLYCQAFQLDERQATLFLAMAFSDFLINEFGFQLYKDSQPEYPLRGMTLKYDQNGVLLSLYPYEYANKVINYEAEFAGLYEKVKTSLDNLPSKESFLNNLD